VSLERPGQNESGALISTLSCPWSDGNIAIKLLPLELLEKLSSRVPPPCGHQVRDGGCLAPHSKLRAAITPTPRQQGKAASPGVLPNSLLLTRDWWRVGSRCVRSVRRSYSPLASSPSTRYYPGIPRLSCCGPIEAWSSLSADPVATGYDPLVDAEPELARTLSASVQQRIDFGERAGQRSVVSVSRMTAVGSASHCRATAWSSRRRSRSASRARAWRHAAQTRWVRGRSATV
jgi:hypothetical protein